MNCKVRHKKETKHVETEEEKLNTITKQLKRERNEGKLSHTSSEAKLSYIKFNLITVRLTFMDFMYYVLFINKREQ